MSDITTRAGKGSPLTNDELDDNFVNLNDDKLESDDLIASDTSFDNTHSGLTATNVQAAVDELQDKKLNIADLAANVVLYPTDTASDISTYYKMVDSTDHADYDTTAVDISTGSITADDQFIAALASEAGVLEGSTGSINLHTIGNVKRTAGSQDGTFYFKVFHRNSSGTETEIGTSNTTVAVSNTTYEQFFADCLIDDTVFAATDRIVIKYYGNTAATGSASTYSFQFGGTQPVRTNLPVPVTVIPHVNDADEISVDTSSFSGNLSGSDDNVQAALETLDALAVSGSIEDLSDVASMNPTDGQLLTWDNTNSQWNAEDAPVSLPDQTGNSGSFLTTNGTTASWTTIDEDQTVTLTGGTNVTVTGTYPNFTISSTDTNTQLTNEQVQDIVGAMFTGNTESGISVTYQDADGTIDLNVNDPTITLTGDVTGSATMTNLGNVSITATVANDSHTHDTRYARRHAGTSSLTSGSYARIARIEGNNLATGVRVHLSGTTNSVVIDVIADIMCNHHQDIHVFTQSGAYTQPDIKVFSNGSNEDFDLYVKYTGGGSSLSLAVEIFPLSNETVTLNPTATAYSSGTEHIHTTEVGLKATQSSGNVNMRIDGNFFSGTNTVWHSGNDGSGSGLDADLLDGQHGSYYLNWNNITNPPTIPSEPNDATITISAGTGLSGGGNFTTDQASNETITLSHADTSTLSGVYGSTANGTKIDTITVDANGHITAIATGATGDINGVTAGSGLSGGGTSGTVTLNHADTSSQASVNNSGNTFIQDVTLDTYGHVTALTSASVNTTNFILEDGDGTEVNITDGKEIKFVEGGGVDINWTDTSNGSDADPYDMTFTIASSITAGSGLTGGGQLNASRTISHADTSSQSSVNNSNGTVIQDVTLDDFGHVTALGSVNLDNRYSQTSHVHDYWALDGSNNKQKIGSEGSGTNDDWRLIATYTFTGQYQNVNSVYKIHGRAVEPYEVYVDYEYGTSAFSRERFHAAGSIDMDSHTWKAVTDDANKTLKIYFKRGNDWNATYMTIMPSYFNGSSRVFSNSYYGTTAPSGNSDITLSNSSGFKKLWNVDNDGSGSGLDADKLDGYHESTFMRKDANSALDMNNYNITNVNHLTFNDSGVSEGLQWLGGNDWRIYESPDDMSNASGNLQFTTGTTHKATIKTNGDMAISGDLYVGGGNVHVNSGNSRIKYTMWGDNDGTYGIGMSSGYTFGALNDYAMSFQMNDDSDRGFWWGDSAHTNAQGAMSLTTNGHLAVANTVKIGYGESNTSGAAYDLDVSGNGHITGSLHVGSYIYHDGDTNSYLRFVAADDVQLVAGGRQMLRMDEGTDPDKLRFVTDSDWTNSSGEWNMSGNVTSGGSFIANSDERLKSDIETITDALAKVKSLRGTSYVKNDRAEIGVIAQEVEDIIPEVVHTADDEIGTKSVAYGNLVGLLIEAVKELSDKVEALESKES